LKRILVLLSVGVLWATGASAQVPQVLAYGNCAGTPCPLKASSDGTLAGGGGLTSDADDDTIAFSQTNDNNHSLAYESNGIAWKRKLFGVAGTASAQVTTVQGIASMTPLLVTFSGSNSVANTTFGATQDGTWTVQPGNTANTTPWLVAGQPCTLTRRISVGTTEDELQIKGTPGTLCGISVTNNHASANAFVKFTNLTAANTTPGSSTVVYSIMVPANGGVVDGAIDATFDTAITMYLVLGEADTDVAEVAANDLHVNVRWK
jgi:hypothetical protein